VPVQRIDYVFHTPDVEVRSFRVICEAAGSDHLPIVAELDLGSREGHVP
jgi:endonuclease/exonuclease/phosphatase family metal-dependent hydrolase